MYQQVIKSVMEFYQPTCVVLQVSHQICDGILPTYMCGITGKFYTCVVLQVNFILVWFYR